ncbi:hypothetical protein [Azovibrio restrictus]|uniref:hypothetical protein n=1 Tax=Azovibrio restrictus TaxID=146938 RepID=UPI001B7FC25B|nr:hypothetical protein [Azovibrio restrictus]
MPEEAEGTQEDVARLPTDLENLSIMQIEVFSTPEEFVGFVKEVVQAIGANIYATADRTQPLKQIEPDKLLDYQHVTCKRQVAYADDFVTIANKAANDLYRADIYNMVTIQFGRSSDTQMECNTCLADTSDMSKMFAKVMKKVLKTTTRADLVLASTGQLVKGLKFYYSEAAAQSGKRFTTALNSRVEFMPAPREQGF